MNQAFGLEARTLREQQEMDEVSKSRLLPAEAGAPSYSLPAEPETSAPDRDDKAPVSSIAILMLASNHVAHMSASSLTVLAHVKAKPGKEAEMRKELLSLVAPSRKDAGCINYDLHQGAENPALFMFHENWASKAHLDAHLQKPDLQAVLARVGQLVAEPPQITLWEKIA